MVLNPELQGASIKKFLMPLGEFYQKVLCVRNKKPRIGGALRSVVFCALQERLIFYLGERG